MDIIVDETRRSLMKGLMWNNIPGFAVLTGKNGCGKTQLLAYIKYNLTKIKKTYQDDEICIIYERLKIEHKGSPNSLPLFSEKLITSLRQHKTKQSHKDDYSDYLMEMAKSIDKNLEDFDEYDIENSVANTIDTGEKLKKAIASYEKYRRDKIINLHDKSTDEQVSKVKDPSPCELINQLLDEYNSDFHIEKPKLPKDIDLNNLNFNINFINNKNKCSCLFNQLSTGEQSLIQMIIAIYNSNGIMTTKILLLDEIDRHLHPSACKTLINIIYNRFFKEYGIKIILTTHCLATIAFCPEDSLFIMEEGCDEIKGISKKSAMNIISDNDLSFEEGMEIINQITQSRASVILLVEGKHDKTHISVAKAKLGKTTDFEIFSLNGSSNLKGFINSSPANFFGEKTIIGIFDLDSGGIKEFEKIGQEIYPNIRLSKKTSKSSVYAITLPAHNSEFKKYKNLPIEFLYEKNILDSVNINLKKINFKCATNKYGYADDETHFNSDESLWLYTLEDDDGKKRLAEIVETLDASSFIHFSPLFELIDKLLELDAN